ncbi:MAG: HEAT repeat domain-containing protein [Planctomycetota bacterium]|nr:HEAT repeat domain-containing protein [Planctomycetota bacterium]
MEIRFCSVCNESIPDGEFDAGRAIVSGQKSQHVACALKRSVEMSGWRSWLTLLLALFGASVATYLLVQKLDEKKKPLTIAELPSVKEHVADSVRASEERAVKRFDAQSTELTKLNDSFEKALNTRLAEHGASIKGATTEAMDKLLRDTSNQMSDRLQALNRLVVKLQGQMADLVDWKIRIQQEADQLRRELEQAKRREPAQPTPAEPVQPKEEPKPATPSEEEEQRLKEIERWRKRLRDSDEDIVFSATIELARLKALEAVPDLVRVLNKHKDFYARLGAATALGEIQAVAAVPDLIEALNDKDDLVRTAASEALHRITGQDFNFVSGLTKNERIRIQKKWRQWWRDNETELRAKLGQPAK